MKGVNFQNTFIPSLPFRIIEIRGGDEGMNPYVHINSSPYHPSPPFLDYGERMDLVVLIHTFKRARLWFRGRASSG